MGLSTESTTKNTASPIDSDVVLDEALGSGPGSSGQVVPEDTNVAGGEEVIVGKSWKRTINKPSAEEVLRHMISHVPYRSWCEHCVRGKAKDSPHFQVSREEWESEPVYTWDYMYLKTKDDVGDSAKSSGGCTDLGDRPIIVGKDEPGGLLPML